MSLDTFRDCFGRVLLRSPVAGPILASDWVRNAFRRVAKKRLWSWLVGYGEAIFPNKVNAGTVTVTLNNNQVIGDATAAAAWNTAQTTLGQSLIGQQFRLASTQPIYTITAVSTTVNPNDTLTLDLLWGGPTQAGIGYLIYQAYFTPPSDFASFQTVIDPKMNWQLWANRWTQSNLNTWDAQRASSGNPYSVVFRDYTNVTDTTQVPLPRYEVWPHIQQQYVLPFMYVKQQTDISDLGAFIPRYITGDVLVEGALSDAARWPGPSQDIRNPYYNLQLATQHELRFQSLVGELERLDDELFEQDVSYQMFTAGLPWAPFPGDARFWQSHLLPSLGVGSGVY